MCIPVYAIHSYHLVFKSMHILYCHKSKFKVFKGIALGSYSKIHRYFVLSKTAPLFAAIISDGFPDQLSETDFIY